MPRQITDLQSNQVYKPDAEFGLFPCKTGLMLPLRGSWLFSLLDVFALVAIWP